MGRRRVVGMVSGMHDRQWSGQPRQKEERDRTSESE
jgi:hypothetical protein